MMASHVSETFQVQIKEKINKMCKIFKENRLNSKVEYNLAITDFLNFTCDLKSHLLCYRKQNNRVFSIHKYQTIHHQ